MKTLFLDLEETIIDDWFSFNFINTDKIKKFITDNEFNRFEIFSFAVENNDKIEMFNRIPIIEKHLNIKISRFFTIEEISETVGNTVRFDLEPIEIRQILGKEFCLFKILNFENRKGDFCLLDDMVKHNTEFKTLDFSLKFINPKEL